MRIISTYLSIIFSAGQTSRKANCMIIEIKNAILQGRYRAARMANGELLALYYGIGHYVSENTRSGKWGVGAIEAISKQLQSELSGLRGFSPTNMKNMRVGILECGIPEISH
jgi:hypothetical protein